MLFLMYKPIPPWGSVQRFLPVKWYPGMWRWFSLMVSLSQVSVKNGKSGLTSEITHFTSSIFGARDMVFARRRLTPYSLSFLCSCAQFKVARFEVFRPRALESRGRFWDKTTGMERLLVLLARKVLTWIFNKEKGAKCQPASSRVFFPSTEICSQNLYGPVVLPSAITLRWRLNPPRQPRRVGFTREIPRVVTRRHRSGASGVLLGNDDDNAFRTELV